MAVIGSAFVVVRALTDKLQSDVAKAIDKAATNSRGTGSTIGDNLAAGFASSIGDSEISASIEDAFDGVNFDDIGKQAGQTWGEQFSLASHDELQRSPLSQSLATVGASASDAGRRAGVDWAGEFDHAVVGQIDGNGFLFAPGGPLSGDAGDAGGASGASWVDGFINEVLGGPPPPPPGGGGGGGGPGDADYEASGRRAGGSFSRGFGSGLSGIGDGLFKIITRIALLGTVIATAIGGISALATGLFLMASAASVAASALIVLPGILAGLGLGAVAAVLAFGGIGKAVAAASAAQTEGGQQAEASARQQVLAARAVRDANQRLADTIEENAQRMIDAHDAVRNARERLAQAEEDAANAQEDIGQARLDAAERLQQLGFSVRQAAIDEKEATKALADAQRGYAEALLQPIPFDPEMTEAERLQITLRARAEAQDSLDQATLSSERAADRSSDLQREQAEEQKKGIEGSDEVVRAKEREEAAIENVHEAEASLADARANIATVEKTNARAIRDARQSVADAIYNQKTAQDAATTSASRLDQAMSRLSPEAQHFVNFLIDLRPEIDKLRAAAGKELFPKLENAITRLVNNFFPTLRTALQGVGGAVGDAANRIATGVINMTRDGDFSKIAETAEKTIRRLGSVTGNLIEAFGSILAAASPLINRFTRFLKVQSAIFAAWADSKQKSGVLRDGFKRAGDVAAQLGRIIKNIVEGFFDLGGVGAKSGQGLLDSFEGATKAFANFTDDPKKAERLRKQFGNIADNVRHIGGLILKIGGALFRLGSNKGLKDTSDGIGGLVPKVEELFNHMIDFGPQIVDLIGKIIDILNELSKSDALQTAIGIFSDFASILKPIAGNEFAQSIFASVAAFKALKAVGNFSGLNKVLGGIFGGTAKSLKQMGTNPFKGFIAGLKGTKVGLGEEIPKDQQKSKELGKVAAAANTAGGKLRGAFVKGLDASKKALATTGKVLRDKFLAGLKGLGSRAAEAMKSGDKGAIEVTGRGYAQRLGDAMKKAGGKATAGGKALGGKAVGGIKAAMSGIGSVAAKAAGGLRVFGAAMYAALGPVGLIILAIGLAVGAVILLYKHNETFRKFVDTKLVPALKAIGKWIAEVIWPALKKFGEIIFKIASVYFKTYFAIVKKVINIILDLGRGAVKVGKKIIDGFKAVVDFFKKLPGRLANIGKGIWDWIVDTASDAVDAVGDFIGDIIDFVKDLPKKLFDAGKTAWDWWSDLCDDAVQAVVDFIADAVDFVKDLPKKLFNVGKTAWDWLVELGDKAQAKVEEKIGKLIDFVKGLPAKLLNAGKNLWGWITDKWDDMRTAIGTKVENFVTYVKGLPGKFVSGIKNIWGFISEQWTAMRTAIDEKIGKLVAKIQGLPGLLAKGVGNLWGFITAGLIGVINGALRLLNKGINLINSLIKKLNNIPGVSIRYIPNIGYIVAEKEDEDAGGGMVRGPDGRLHPVASGGTVKAFPGGTAALLAEAGQDERVEPLDSRGLSAGDHAILNAIKALASANAAQVYAPTITVSGQESPRRTAQEILLEQRRAVLASNFIWNS